MRSILKRTFHFAILIVLISISSVIFVPAASAAPATFTVLNTDDSGPGSLRQAIDDANTNSNSSDLDVVEFDIAGTGPHVINLLTPLDNIIEPLRIDGSSQETIDCLTNDLLIQIDGTTAGNNGLTFEAGATGSSVHAISIVNFNGAGISSSAPSFEMTCNNLGVSADGTTPGPNTQGAQIGGNDVTIGGPNAVDGNLVSENANFGLDISNVTDLNVSNNVITSNTSNGIYLIDSVDTNVVSNISAGNIGFGIVIENATNIVLDSNTTSDNGEDGVWFNDSGTSQIDVNNHISQDHSDGAGIVVDNVNTGTIRNSRFVNNAAAGMSIQGGTQNVDIHNNVVGGNAQAGMAIAQTTNVHIYGNFVGMDSDGLTPLPNGQVGMFLIAISASSSGNIIGGTTPSERNYVANSGLGDIALLGFGSLVTGNQVIGNYSGVNINGEVDPNFTNTAQGLLIYGSSQDNIIGGANPGEGNLIAGNAAGVYVISLPGLVPTNNAIIGNSIFSNTSGSNPGLGIDLMHDSDGNNVPDADVGVNSNDVNDADTGANGYLNYPIISNIDTSGDDVTITYSLDVPAPVAPVTGYRIEYYANVTANPSGHGDGQIFLGYENVTGSLTDHTFTIADTDLPDGTYSFAMTATEINPSLPFGFGSTSEYSAVQVAGISVSQTSTPTTTQQSGSSDSATAGTTANGSLPATGTYNIAVQLNTALAIMFTGIMLLVPMLRRRKISSM